MRLLLVPVVVGLAVVAACTSGSPTSIPTSVVSTSSPDASATSSSPATSPTRTATATPTAAAASPVTLRYVVRPVTAAGRPAQGYRVTTYTSQGYTCDGLEPSRVTVDAGVLGCGGVSDNTEACWKSEVPSTVLCLREPSVRALVRVNYSGGFPTLAPPAHPWPQEIVLDNGDRCVINLGVAVVQLQAHPSWEFDYGCFGGLLIYGPRSGIGINESARTWTVFTTPNSSQGKGPLAKHAVRAAYYVGTN